MPSIQTTKSFIVDVEYGGLGDSLFFSHLPRIAKEAGGYDKVYVSHAIPFRDDQYKEMIWEKNPFVDGFCDERAASPSIDDMKPGMNVLDKIMLFYGLDDGRRFHRPELYYTPKLLPDLHGKSLYDPNYVSYVGAIRPEEIESFFRDEELAIDFQMKARDKSLSLATGNTREAVSLENFCDMLASCQSLYCLASGTATLASALGKPATVFYGCGQNKVFHHWRQHNYVQVGVTDCVEPRQSRRKRLRTLGRKVISLMSRKP